MLIISKTTAAARPVSLEQIAEMVIAPQSRTLINNRWRYCNNCSKPLPNRCNQQQQHQQNSYQSITNKMCESHHNTTAKRSINDEQVHHSQHHPCHNKIASAKQSIIVIAVTIALCVFVTSPAFVTAAAKKTAVRSIATHENDPNRLHANWLEYQRKNAPVRSAKQEQQPHYLSPELGNIFSQLGFFIQARQRNATELAEHIFFKYYNTEGDLIYESNFSKPHDLYMAQCYPNGRFAILLHGWRESCNTTWMKQLIRKIGTYRGGCIICMDYSRYAAASYVRLVRVFDPVAQILTMQLHLLDYMGFDMNNGYLFGFSYGGQLATEAGRRIGNKRLKEIDICDPAGPGFDHRSNQPNHRDAAQNVQCIHTSRDKGTRFYNCHQDWRLGNCGLTQVASSNPPLGSHGLCPYMYVNAFDYDFYAIKKPEDCISKRMATYWPPNFKMGYNEKRKWQVSGELFAQTSKYHPFNIISNNTESSNAISKEVTYRDVSSTPDIFQPNSNVLQKLKERILRYVFQDQFFH